MYCIVAYATLQTAAAKLRGIFYCRDIPPFFMKNFVCPTVNSTNHKAPEPLQKLHVLPTVASVTQMLKQNVQALFAAPPKRRKNATDMQTLPAYIQVLKKRELLSGVGASLDSQLTQIAANNGGLETESALVQLQANTDLLEHLALHSESTTTEVVTFDTPTDTGNWQHDGTITIQDGALLSTNTVQNLFTSAPLAEDWSLSFNLTETSGYTGGNRYEQTIAIGASDSALRGYRVMIQRSGWRYNDSSIGIVLPNGTYQGFKTPFQFGNAVDVTLSHSNKTLDITVKDPSNGSQFSTNISFDQTLLESDTISVQHHYFDNRNTNPLLGRLDNLALTTTDAYTIEDWLQDPANRAYILSLAPPEEVVYNLLIPTVEFSTNNEMVEIEPAIWVHSVQESTVHLLIDTPSDASTITLSDAKNSFETITLEHTGGTRLTSVFLPIISNRHNLVTSTIVQLRDQNGAIIASEELSLINGKLNPQTKITWDAPLYQQQLASWQTATQENNAYQALITDASTSIVHNSIETSLASRQHWGELWNNMQSVRLISGQVGIHYEAGGQILSKSQYFISQEDFMANVYADNPDVFTSDGKSQPGKVNAWQMIRNNAREGYNNVIRSLEIKFQIGADLLAEILNGGEHVQSIYMSLEDSGWQWGHSIVPNGSVNGVHANFTMQQFLTEIQRVLGSEAFKPQLQHWGAEIDQIEANDAIKLAQDVWWHQNRNRMQMNDAIMKGQTVVDEGITTAQREQNLALFKQANDQMIADRATNAEEIRNSRSFKRAERLIATTLANSNHSVAQAVRDASNETYIAHYDVAHRTKISFTDVQGIAIEITNINTSTPDTFEAGIQDIEAKILATIHPEAVLEAKGANALHGTQKLQLVRSWFAQHGQQTQTVRTDTVAGQLFHGVVGALQAMEEWGLGIQIVNVASSITDIAPQKILNVVRPGMGNIPFSLDCIPALKALFTSAGYNLDPTAKNFGQVGIIHADPNKNADDVTTASSLEAIAAHTYSNNETIRIRFDVAEHSAIFSHAHVYVLNDHGEQIGDFIGNTNSYGTSGQLFVEVTAAEVLQKIGYSAANGTATVTLKIAVWCTPLNQTVYSNDGMVSSGTTVRVFIDTTQPIVEQLSVHPDAEQAAIENLILNEVQFPLNETYKDSKWYVANGSDYHIGNDQFAIDINTISGSDSDEFAPVLSAANGYIIKMDQQNYGAVTIEHTTTRYINGVPQEVMWQTKYLHMNLDQNLIDTWEQSGKKLHVGAGTQIGTIGKWGNNNATAFVAHLHFSVHTSNGQSVNLHNWMADNIEHQTVTYNGVNTKIKWSTQKNAWVDFFNTDLIWNAESSTFYQE